MDHCTEILDLRTALEVLRAAPGQLIETNVEVDPAAELSIFLQPGSRHIGAMAERATELGQSLPISVSIGVDPAIEVLSCFEPPTTPLGFNELSIAGALRQKPVELVKCVSVNEHSIANAEYVIEGEILPGSNHVVEDQNSHTGYAMPEFPGYNGPSEEHVNMAGIPTEASILGMTPVPTRPTPPPSPTWGCPARPSSTAPCLLN